MDDSWKNNEKLSGIDQNKLDMLTQLARQGSQKKPADLLPFLMGAASQGKNGGLKFNAEEISAVIDVLKTGKSKEEIERLDRIIHLLRQIK